ncbi:sugar-transfer associated ATP-grasp domain-containing protein [Dongia sedimenti]|uniref:Sugar-transfer associated ATP-grasp domain-containing protein n=1 Tax=Dongia sedimenti TaxID=3064282 RepID=A0ABU0YLW6_9PROT|nr:sugar-transfer associated ATP-grasp domain-containing protein [Rhodospirillaceae bacterium R-7]
MRDNLFPPPWFNSAGNRAPSPAARRVHEICNRAVWRSLGGAERVWAALLSIVWPATAAAFALPLWWRNAAAVRRLTGKGAGRQFREIIALAVRHRIVPKYYFAFELYLDEHKARAGNYLMRYETKEIAYRLLRPKVQTPGIPIKDKIGFAHYCAQHGLRAVPLVAAFRDGARTAEFAGGQLPERDLFVKPVMSKGGFGAERWNWAGNGLYRRTTGDELTGPALVERIANLSRRQPYLMQWAMTNHADLRALSVGALCTVRMLSCLDERGVPEVTDAVLRMSINPQSAVDNFHAGGIAAAVDLATGRLGPASDLGYGPHFVWHERQPQTGAQIAGRVLPYWAETMALAAKAHAAFSEWTVIGWDIAILDDGPCLIEGNKGPGIHVIQRCLRRPIGDGRFGILLAHHLEQRAL